jgi:hypothetical protein
MDEHAKKNKELMELTQTEGWKIVKGLLLDKINDLQSINNIDYTNADEVFLDIKVRKNVIMILVEWLKDVEGRVEQFAMNDLSLDEDDFNHVIRGE